MNLRIHLTIHSVFSKSVRFLEIILAFLIYSKFSCDVYNVFQHKYLAMNLFLL